MKKIFAFLLYLNLCLSPITVFANQTPPKIFTYSQVAGSAKITSNTDDADVYTLTLSNVKQDVQWVARTPDRRYGVMSISNFADKWLDSSRPNSFAHTPPLAELFWAPQNNEQKPYLFLLIQSAKYDAAKNTVTYQVKPLNDENRPQGTLERNSVALVTVGNR